RRWKFINRDGSQDRRFRDNVELPVVRCGILSISIAGSELNMMTTNPAVPASVQAKLEAVKDTAPSSLDYPMALPAPQAAVGAAESQEPVASSDSGRSHLTPVFGLVGAALILLVLALAIAGSRQQAPDMVQAGASASDRSSGTVLPSMRPPEGRDHSAGSTGPPAKPPEEPDRGQAPPTPTKSEKGP